MGQVMHGFLGRVCKNGYTLKIVSSFCFIFVGLIRKFTLVCFVHSCVKQQSTLHCVCSFSLVSQLARVCFVFLWQSGVF